MLPKSQKLVQPSKLAASSWRSQSSRIGFFVSALLCLTLISLQVHAQSASEMQNAAPEKRPGETEEQHGKRLLDEMVKALGGNAWLNKTTLYREGQTAAFFRGTPTGSVVRFVEYRRYARGSEPETSRVEFLHIRGMIMPGMKRDVIHLWTANNGYELTYKGQTALPQPQVIDYLRRRDHSLEEVMRTWVKQPDVMIVAEGIGMRDRHAIDKVSILTANNDSVTLELDQDTHLPLQRAFEWRNTQFKDHDLDEEVYGDWRQFDGIMTPMNMTDYRNGDMVSQNFYTKVHFDQPMNDDVWNVEKLKDQASQLNKK